MFNSIGRTVLALTGVAVLSACAGGPSGPRIPIPDDYGLYAITSEDDLRRLDGTKAWEVETWNTRSDLSPSQQFVLYDPALASRGVSDVDIEVWQVAWARSTIRDDGSAAPIDGSKWVVAPLDAFRVPLSFRSVDDRPDMVHLVPQEPLPAGLYSLQLRQGATIRTARFGVQWSSVDKQEYSATHCVDERAGASPAFDLCARPRETTASTESGDGARDLRISLVDPVTTNVGGRSALIIQGTVTNRGSTTQRLPMLEATLQDRGGSVLLHWPFMLQQTALAPGETASFRTEVQQPPAGTARVNVRFATASAAGLP